jgi:2-polyprenyl-3-methyl-5-hydroxy-6-metoxy-1,4-benzoquinol methylase
MTEEAMEHIVKNGYDSGDYTRVYRNRNSLLPFEEDLFNKLTDGLCESAKVLDLGSGPGIPYDLHLVQKGLIVTGIDISEKHVSLARINVPSAKYILGNFLDHHFLYNQFDAVICLYALFHIPRERHKQVISKIATTLKPDGKLLITVGTENVTHKERPDFCGSRMAWSYFDTEKNLEIILDCGFQILKTINEKDHGSSEKHVWILATKA